MINNDVLLEKIENLDEKVVMGFAGVNDHLKTLNGQTSKNSEFRLKTQGSISTIKYLVAVLGVGNIILMFKVFI